MTDVTHRIPLQPITTEAASPPLSSSYPVSLLDKILVFLTLSLAFLVSSFAVRNADHWLHLATGRLIAEGKYQFGVDPFALATEGVRWVNHSWLYDWIVYQIGDLGGGLVVLKASLVALIAWVIIRTAKSTSWAWAAIFTALAILAASPRFLLQPVLVSYLFLALTLLIVLRGSQKQQWILPFLFTLWVNFDDWFVLGPMTVAIFAAGRWPWDRTTRHLFIIAVVGTAACLINPHHIHAFRWPMEISPHVLSSPLREDSRFNRLLIWSLSWERWTQTNQALNPAGIAYLVLTAVGILSFLRNRSARSDGRLALWLFFGILSVFQSRLVPFFAIVAAPMTARTLAESLSGAVTPHDEHGDRAQRLLRFRLLASLVLMTSNFAAWPGWLHATPHELRRVDWSIRPDLSLRLAAERLRHWYELGHVTAASTVYNTHPDAGPYLAWFGPPLRYAMDPRLTLFAQSSHAKNYVGTYRWIMGANEENPLQEVQQPSQTLVLGYETSAPRASDIFAGRLTEKNSSWELLSIDGKATLFGRSGAAGLKLANLKFNPMREVYRSRVPVDAEGGIFPEPLTFWQWYVRRPPERSVHLDAAIMCLRQFDELGLKRQLGLDGDPKAGALAQLVVSALPLLPSLALGFSDVTFRMANFSMFVPPVDPAPPEYAYLALRLARRAVYENPNRGETWLRLGQAYLSLRLRTLEGAWSKDLTLIEQIRHAQIAFALETALQLEPGSIVAHRMLANLYTERGYLDAAFEHRRREIELMRAGGPSAHESPDEFERYLENAANRLREMDRQLQERENQYVVQVGNLGSRPLEQAQTAIRLGLARKALDEILLPSDVRLFGINGAQLQLHLMLTLGRAKQVRDFLETPELVENPERLDVVAVAAHGGPGYISEYRMLAYDWYRAMVFAISGDYSQAERALHTIEQRTKIDAEDEGEKVRQRLALLLAAEIGSASMPDIFIYRARVMENRIAYEKLMQAMFLANLLRADLKTTAGLLALEQGDSDKARKHFSEALQLAQDPTGEPRSFAGRALAEAMLRRLGEAAGASPHLAGHPKQTQSAD